MMAVKSSTKKKWYRSWWKIIIAGLILLLVLISMITLKLDSIALALINKGLETSLSVEGKLESIHLHLLSGRCDLNNMSLEQPQGYTEPALFSLGKLTIQVDPKTLLDDEIIIDQILLKNISVRLVRDKQGHLNIEKVVAPSDASSPAQTSAESDLELPAVQIKSIKVEDVTVQIVDHQTKKQWTTHFRIDLAVEDLQLRDILKGDILLDQVTFALANLSIDQPEGFGSNKLLTLDKLAVKTSKFDLSATEYRIDDISLQGFSTAIIVHKDGASNVEKLLTVLRGPAAKDAPAPKVEASDKASSLPVIRIGNINVNDGRFVLHDAALMEQSLDISLEKISLQIKKLSLFDPVTTTKPASVEVRFELPQPEGLPPARFCGFATLGPVGDGIPQLNSQTRLVGLKFDTFGELITPAVRNALGATGIDAGTSLALTPDAIKLHSRALTDRNIVYDTMSIHGPLSSPEINVGALFAGFSRIKGGLLNLGKDSLSAGFGIGKAGVDVTKDVGVGAYRLGKHLGGQLFDVGAGLVTFDAEKVGSGIVGSTSGTVGVTSDVLKTSGSTTTTGLKNSASSLNGGGRITTWDEEIPKRYQQTMIQAQADLAEMPYPPVTE